MFRLTSSTAVRRTIQRIAVRGPPTSSALQQQVHYYHASLKREEESAVAPPVAKSAPVEPPAKGSWDPIYSVPLGLAFAIPAIHYEWYLINEETQLAVCFMAFVMIFYKQFGGMIHEALEADGKRILAEHNRAEDEIISILQEKINDVKMQENIVKDAEDIHAIRLQTYEKLSAAGKIKPLYDFKAQMERILHLMEAEETNVREKAKVALMAEATAFVRSEFAKNASLKTSSLDSAIAMLKGSTAKAAEDPVKAAYLKFFKEKSIAASKVDSAAETKEARQAMIAKLNAVAKNEGFFFHIDAQGKPTVAA